MRNLIFVFLGFALIFSACGKYEDGPKLSLASKKSRAVGVWVYQQVLANGTDITSLVGADSKYELMDNEKYQVRSGNVITEEGTWNFGSKKETIETLATGSSTKTVETILRLTKDEFWTTYVELGITYEVHYKAE
jgi:hypothetical protein